MGLAQNQDNTTDLFCQDTRHEATWPQIYTIPGKLGCQVTLT